MYNITIFFFTHNEIFKIFGLILSSIIFILQYNYHTILRYTATPVLINKYKIIIHVL